MGRARPDPAVGAWRRWLQDRAAAVGPDGAVRDLVEVLGTWGRRSHAGAPTGLPGGYEPADVCAASREWLLSAGDRRARGSVYTPPTIARGVLAQAVEGWAVPARPLACDPACGGGAFLLAAARWLHATGREPDEILAELLWGADVDGSAIPMAVDALRLWAASAGSADATVAADHVVVGDPLRTGAAAWPGGAPSFDLVVGNPPFQGQLGRGTVRPRADAAALRALLGDAATGYVDTAALFLVVARSLAAPGGRVSLVLPESVLGARDGTSARAAVLRDASLAGLWVAAEPVFEASTKVCAPVVEVDGAGGTSGATVVRRHRGAAFDELPSAEHDPSWTSGSPWSGLALAAHGTPTVEVTARFGVLADLVAATAGFRQQFYGLVPFVREGGPGALLVTAGAIDPGEHGWGRRPARFAGTTWQRPVVDVDALDAGDPALAAWVRRRLVPKVLVATQTRVVEAVADPKGEWVPSVPVLSVEPFDADDVWAVLAVLLAPTTSAWALAHAGGTALATDTIKLSARQVGLVPLPSDATAWREAATGLDSPEAPDWELFGRTMLRAYGLGEDHPVFGWWRDRLGTTLATARSRVMGGSQR